MDDNSGERSRQRNQRNESVGYVWWAHIFRRQERTDMMTYITRVKDKNMDQPGKQRMSSNGEEPR